MRIVNSSILCYAAILAVVVGVGIAMRNAPGTMVTDRLPSDEAIAMYGQRLDDFWQARQAFLTYMHQVMKEIVWGRLALREGVERINLYCQERYPIFLYHLTFADAGRSIPEKIAWILVEHIRSDIENGNGPGWPAEVVERLDEELLTVRPATSF